MDPLTPALFIGHGSPMTPVTENPERRAIEALGRRLPRPKAILCVTAHWETHGRTHVTAGPSPRTIHDFGGFPRELYEVRYPAPGAEGLASRVADLVGAERIVPDTGWGFDHGVWGVLMPLFPDAHVPVLAMSLDRSLDATGHLAIGRQLRPLRHEGVMIVGSGNVVHNLSMWRALAGSKPDWALDYQQRVSTAVLAGDVDALLSFHPDDAAAAAAVNSAEHFLPLLYPLGASEADEPVTIFNDTVDGAISMTSYLFGDPGLLDGTVALTAATA